MSYIKNYEVGNIRVDVPQKHFIYELPLFSFSDACDSLAVSLVYQSKMTDNPFYMANGFKLNLHKRLIMADGVPQSYEDGNGNLVKLNRFGNKYAFDDGSYRFIRLIDEKFVLENPDYSKEYFWTDGRILYTEDKYGNLILSYFYSNSGKLAEVDYKGTRSVKFVYSGTSVHAIEYTYDDGNEETPDTLRISFDFLDARVVVNHYSGVDYHVAALTNGLEAYSTNAGEAFSSTFSQKVTAIASGNTITLEKFLGNKKLDSTLYDFVHLDSEGKVDILDITNFQGVKTRMQFANGKPAFSYEIQESATDPVPFVPYTYTYASTSDTLPHYPGRVTYYNNSEASGSQGYGDGLPMFCGTNTHYDDINRYVCLSDVSGIVILSGWLKAHEASTSCSIKVFVDDVQMVPPFEVKGLLTGQWQYFTRTFFVEENSTVRVETDEFVSAVEGRDFRLTGKVATTQELAENASNLLMSAGVLFHTDSSGATHTIPITNSVEYYNGTMLGREAYPFSVEELIRYRMGELYGAHTGEIYYNGGRGILAEQGTFHIRYHVDASTYVSTPIDTLDFGKMYTIKGITYVTRNTFYLENGLPRMKITTYKNGVETGHQIYDEHLDLIESVRKTRVNNILQSSTTVYSKETDAETGNEVRTSTTTMPNGEVITTSATYDADDFLVSTKDEFGVVTTYQVDKRWGVVTDTSVENGMGVSNTFDDDCTTLETRTFGITTPKDHRISYANGMCSSVTDGVLAYAFGYDESGLPSSVSKNGLSVEQIETTDNGKVVTTSYPAEASPLFTTVQRYDKYGRLTAVDGLITNTYDVNPTQYLDVYSTAGVDNGGGKLATATDHLTGNVRKYAYQGNKISRITAFDAAGNKLNFETFQYDEHGRLTQSSFTYDPANVKRTQLQLSYEASEDGTYDNSAVQASYYIVNGVEYISTSNTFDVMNRLTQKSFVLKQTRGYQRHYTYDKTRVHTIKDNWNLTDTIVGESYYTYDVMGRVKAVSYTTKDDTNYYTTYEYDQYGQLVRENNQALAKTFVYVYNDIGNITSIKEYPFTLSASVGGTYTERVYTYNTSCPDRFNKRNGASVYYNSMGYPTFYDGKSCTWTKGKLTRLHKGNPSQVGSLYEDCVLTYDAYGRRLSKSYTYDPNPAVTSDTSYTYNITYDYDNSGRLIREYCTGAYTFNNGFSYTREFIYLYDENEIIGVLHSYNGAALKPYFFHKNLQGDVIAICDENGNVVAEYAYDAWGNCTVKKGSGDVVQYNPIRYRSYYWDRESNLYFVGGRYYDPTCGRFISPASVANMNPSAHVGLNLYLYAGNDPVNGVYGGASAGGAPWSVTFGVATSGTALLRYERVQQKVFVNINVWRAISNAYNSFDKQIGPIIGGMDAVLSFLESTGTSAILGEFAKGLQCFGIVQTVVGSFLSWANSVYRNYNNPNYTGQEPLWASIMDATYYSLKGWGTYALGQKTTELSVIAGGCISTNTGSVSLGVITALGVGATGAFLIYWLGEGADWLYEQLKEWIFE